MITEAPSSVVELLNTSGAAAAGSLASSEPLAAGPAGAELGDFDVSGQAVHAQFNGPISGDLVVVVDDELGNALQESPLGPLELASALSPVFDAIGLAVGQITFGPAQQADVRLVVARALAHANWGVVPLLGASGARAVVVVGVDGITSAEPESVPGTASAADAFVPAPDRLDLLRGVEMQATAELGRVRMTVNELLALRDGAVIELDRAAGAPADLYVNGRLIARGEVVVVDENYGLRITEVVSDENGR